MTDEKGIFIWGIHDFRPADTSISGCIIFHDTNSEGYMPYGWIHGGISYSGKKMSKGPYVFFEYRTTTAFNGGEYSKEAAIKLAKEQKEDIIIENCLLACKVKEDKLVPLQDNNAS